METTFRDRLREFAAAKGMSIKAFQDAIGVSNAHFANTQKVSPKVAIKIKAKFPDADIDYINTGIHDQHNSDFIVQQSQATTVPLLPIFAMAGQLTEFVSQISDYDCERIVSPIKDAQIAMTVSGDSMTPEYPNGCIVLLQKIDENAFIEWGKTFVLDTTNGVVIKKLFPAPDNEQYVVCRSVNPNYSDFKIAKKDVFGWYIVRMQMAQK